MNLAWQTSFMWDGAIIHLDMQALAPISNKEAQAILNRVEEGVNKPRPKVLFEAGEVIRIVDGPFKDFNGEVEEVIYEKSKLRVSVLIFGRATSVELNFDQVEKT
jgi:transcriptional antiterminator NusG